jgi:hypothetical protein
MSSFRKVLLQIMHKTLGGSPGVSFGEERKCRRGSVKVSTKTQGFTFLDDENHS